MREIKFRGKRIDNGEWVYGCLTRYSREMSYITVDLIENEVYEVYTDTVGEYIGLREMEIYEGDIARCYGGEYWQGTWEFNVVIEIDSILNPRVLMHLSESENLKIIGNIHDNPELVQI
ncbi:YopX protein [Tissierella praeacuta DSM 18095]|uniref:YopX protein n=1 Tax=Tissierella praeacuta DSM 18095 TaxID=1123404 RepID=A0A1M4Z7M7_9FIRM|nr:YopX family protein [Tissierella praeacuta]TCU67522.1 YopX protein [Tissierella praeacuta]SHF13958.1 YopX protein [Tissierella praeacuta DSM 18095]SUP00555.1 YopX protein [Tissierella praeacuta]